MKHRLFADAQKHIENNYPRLLANLKELATIPSPSNNEIKRAQWVKEYMNNFGAKGVYIDDALNVIYPYNAENCDQLVVFAAHNDIVFPDLTSLCVTEDEEKIYAPGIGDNTTSVSCMLELARFFTENDIKPNTGFLFVANSAEEGLGNLRGIRQIVKDFEGKIKEVIAIDGASFESYVDNAVGSHRYRVVVATEGGHSYGSFGNRNAIYYMSQIITSLYAMKVPNIGKTTYNVGTISGGTSVNTIAQHCEILYEFRSDEKEALKIMDNMFLGMISAYNNMGIKVSCELLGERPCKGDVDLTQLKNRVETVAKQFSLQLTSHASSTDCNIPLSMGIPSVCIATYKGMGAHTREEFIWKNSMREGMQYLAAFMLSYLD